MLVPSAAVLLSSVDVLSESDDESSLPELSSAISSLSELSLRLFSSAAVEDVSSFKIVDPTSPELSWDELTAELSSLSENLPIAYKLPSVNTISTAQVPSTIDTFFKIGPFLLVGLIFIFLPVSKVPFIVFTIPSSVRTTVLLLSESELRTIPFIV